MRFVVSSKGKYFLLVGVRHSESKRWSVEGDDGNDEDSDDVRSVSIANSDTTRRKSKKNQVVDVYFDAVTIHK
jgi:hypothetical protein